jgi:hypothetical protein
VVIHFVAHGGDEGVRLALATGAQCLQLIHEGLGGGASFPARPSPALRALHAFVRG